MKHPVPIGDLSRYQWQITDEGWRAILKAREELLAERRTARGQQRQAQAGKEEARKKEEGVITNSLPLVIYSQHIDSLFDVSSLER